MATDIKNFELIKNMIEEPKSGIESQIVRIGLFNKIIRKVNELIDYFFNTIYWDDLRAPATAINPPGLVSDPDWDNTNGGWLFDAAGTEVLWIVTQMPHTYKEGSNIQPHIHWQPTNTNTGNVLWRMEYKWTNVGDVEAAGFTTLNVLDAGAGVARTQQIAGFGEIDGTGKRISSMLVLKLSRIGGDATDTYNADALLREFDIHYQVDARGSEEQFVK